MPITTQEISICLFQLPDKDQAVIQRVITFGASQGKPYTLHTDPTSAHIIIAPDALPVPPNNAVNIRIGELSNAHCDLTLARPLLVTRVMRVLDDAAHLVRSKPTTDIAPTQLPETQATEAQTAPSPTPAFQNAPEQQPSITLKATNPDVTNTRESTVTSLTTPEPHTNKTGNTSVVTTGKTIAPTTETPATTAAEDSPSSTTSSITEMDEPDYLYTALVVDDSAAIRKQLEIELRNAQIKAEFAETGEEALEKSQVKLYDLVFLDIIMPGIDGYEVCRQMRSRKAMKKTPIIMLSGKTSPLDEVQGVIAGASTYLTKPVKHEQFQQTLKRVSKWLTNFAH